MAAHLDDKFIEEINQNIGIAHKVCRIYFPGSDEQEDILQEMMYQLWRSYPTFQHQAKFSSWMYRVCLNTASTYLRKSKKNQEKPITDKHHQIPDLSHERSDENLDMLYQAIGMLTVVNKAVILLYMEDLSYEEIAQITGLTVSNVSVRLVRIKKELEKQLNHLNTTEDVRHGTIKK
jgi:RNA polymerase sigma-70 factor (ECF subfamily)